MIPGDDELADKVSSAGTKLQLAESDHLDNQPMATPYEAPEVDIAEDHSMGYLETLGRFFGRNYSPDFIKTTRSALREHSDVESLVKFPYVVFKDIQNGGSIPDIESGLMMNNRFETGEVFEDFKRLTPESTNGIREEDWSKLLTGTEAQQKEVRNNLLQHYKDQEVLREAGPAGTTLSFLAGGISPEVIVSPLMAVKRGSMIAGFGINTIRGAGYSAGIGSVFNAVHVATHDAATVEDWAERTALDAMVGGLFSGIAGAWKSGAPSVAEGLMEAAMHDLEVTPVFDEAGKLIKIKVDPPVGAYIGESGPSALSSDVNKRVQATQIKLDHGLSGIAEGTDQNILKRGAANAFDYAFGGKGALRFLHSPEIIGARSPYGATRQLFSHLSNKTPLTNLEAEAGKQMTAERFLKDFDYQKTSAQVANYGLYKDYFKTAKNGGQDPISEVMFRDRVGIALRNGDKDPDIAQVSEGAKLIRKKVIQPLSDHLVEIGEMSADAAQTTAESYFMRVYNRDMIRANEQEFVSFLSDYYHDVNQQVAQYAKLGAEEAEALIKSGKVGRELLTSEGSIRSYRDVNEIGYRELLQEEAQATANRILGESDEMISGQIFDMMTGRGGPSMAKSRVLMMSDNRLQKWLVNDVNHVLDVSTQTASRKIAFNKALMQIAQENGATATEAKELVKEGKEYITGRLQKEHADNKRAINAKYAGNEKKRIKELDKEQKLFDQNKQFLGDTIDVFMGTYGRYGSKGLNETIQFEKNLTSTMKLTNMVFSMMPEFLAPAYRQGLYGNLREGIIPVVANLNKLASKSSEARLAMADAGVAVEAFRNTRAMSLNDSVERYTPISTPGRVMQKINQLGSKFSGVNQVADFQELVSAQAFTGRTIRSIKAWEAGKKIKQVEKDRLLAAGINIDRDFPMLIKEINDHAKPINLSWDANVTQWKNDKAANLWNFALNNEVRSVISVSGMFTRPYAASRPVESMLFQMQNWVYRSQNNFLIPLLQGKTLSEGTYRKMSSIIAMSATGLYMNDLKRLALGKEIETDPEKRFWMAFDNSGLGGMQYETYKRIQAVAGLADQGPKKSVAEAFAGPAGAGLDEFQEAMRMFFPDMIGDFAIPWNEKGLHSTLKLLPMLEAGWFKGITNKAVGYWELPKTPGEARRAQSSGRR